MFFVRGKKGVKANSPLVGSVIYDIKKNTYKHCKIKSIVIIKNQNNIVAAAMFTGSDPVYWMGNAHKVWDKHVLYVSDEYRNDEIITFKIYI